MPPGESPVSSSAPAAASSGVSAPAPEKGEAVLYVCYLDIEEPLVSTQVLPYLLGLAGEGYRIHLLTFDKRHPVPERSPALRERALAAGIRLHHLRYHRRPSLLATLYDIARGALWARRTCRRERIRLLHGRSHVGAAIARLAGARLGLPYIFDLRGLLPDEYVDAGHWRHGGVKYRLTKRAERHLLRTADGVVVLTRVLERELRLQAALKAGGCLETIPCCVDIGAYEQARAHREAERRRRGWSDRVVLLYVGKLGGWYLVDEMARFFAEAFRLDRRFHLHVLTQSDARPAREALAREGVPLEAFSVERSFPADTPGVVAAADAGLSLIRPCASKRSSSPTKLGEYLAAGLAVVSTPGIGDTEALLGGGIGLVLRGFDRAGLRTAAAEVLTLVRDCAARERRSALAARQLSLSEIGIPRYARLYRCVLHNRAPALSPGASVHRQGSGVPLQ